MCKCGSKIKGAVVQQPLYATDVVPTGAYLPFGASASMKITTRRMTSIVKVGAIVRLYQSEASDLLTQGAPLWAA